MALHCVTAFRRWADKLDSLSATATQDPEGFLGHPVNAFKLVKRLNTEWGDLESLVLSDTTNGTLSYPCLNNQVMFLFAISY